MKEETKTKAEETERNEFLDNLHKMPLHKDV